MIKLVIVAVWSNFVAHRPVIKPKLPIKNEPKKNEFNLNYIYTGLQIIKPEVFSGLSSSVFSMNKIWDKLIENYELNGVESSVDFLHVSTLDIYKNLLKNFKN